MTKLSGGTPISGRTPITGSTPITPKPDVVKTTIQLPREFWKKVHTRALADDQNMNELVIAALEEYLKKKGGG